MKTISKAQDIVAKVPKEALQDAIGLAVFTLLMFTGFMAPAFL
ncbi:MAG: hypothetical protein AAGB15_10065 [Pseudomonadota bacterium]